MQTLQQARIDCALTQKDLAAKIAVTPRTLRRWEAGLQRPHLKYHRRIAAELGRTIEQFRRMLDATVEQSHARRSSPTIVHQ